MATDATKVVTDIEKPGTTPAGATSRPIITSRAPAVKDPMVSETPAEKEAQDPVRFAPSVTKKTIAPLASQEQKPEVKEENAAPAETPTEPSAETPITEELSEQRADEAAAAAQVALTKEDQQQAELVTKLTEEKKYFVPIGAVQKRRTARTTMLLVVVLLALAAGGVLAIDAGLVETNVTLPFDLIKSAS